ncbi:neuropeptides B/W receptor type 1-like [Scyliorhinus canicula]|uniref:neuropeptides B/W receptor type 1-like n=1 Tax=Scyliorhinus canicula TaxID=7830 RepID=UPI0018F5310F|nr:neuropeptides B/W receptor type 1-like [Scyliorhinus canicula]XP_038665277.1 neuropeptides B/W receptor type 1-like [Scyliorhinus canicula]
MENMDNLPSNPASPNISCRGQGGSCLPPGGNGTNSTGPGPYPDFYIAIPIIYSVICAVGLTGNTAVIYVILKAPKMKTVTNMFILNLAIADELFTLVLPINIADYLLLQWPFGELMCKLIISIDQYNTFSSIYFLTVMSIDRYLVVLATAKSKKMSYRTYRAAKIVSICVWLFVTIIILPFTIFGKIHDDQGRLQCVYVFPSPEILWWKASRIYTLLMGFTIPVSTICILYTMMLLRLRNMRLNTNAKALDKAKKKVTLMVMVILAVCLFCWTPYHLSTIVALTTDIQQTTLIIGISYFITSLSYANSCLNPFLYAFLDDSFRRSFRKLLECRTAP